MIEDIKRKDFVTSVRLGDGEVCSPLSRFAAACKKVSPLVAFLTRAVGLRW